MDTKLAPVTKVSVPTLDASVNINAFPALLTATSLSLSPAPEAYAVGVSVNSINLRDTPSPAET